MSCEGAGGAVLLPEEIEGLPVLEIGAYAFSSPKAEEHLPKGTVLYKTECKECARPGGGEVFLGGESLNEIRLPRGLRSVGEYAFYNCTALTGILLYGGGMRVGNGALMNCRSLKTVTVRAVLSEKTCLPDLLAEIQREVRVVFETDEGRSVWIFPEYYEESVENGPARIFEHFIHGAGYRYRQCFRNDRLDAEAYDAQFPIARNETGPETLLCIALGRLRRPARLSESAAQRYRQYLQEHAADAAKLLVRQDSPEGLAFLAEHGIFTRESLEFAAEEASRLERAECLSVLLHERHSRFDSKEKTFEL